MGWVHRKQYTTNVCLKWINKGHMGQSIQE